MKDNIEEIKELKRQVESFREVVIDNIESKIEDLKNLLVIFDSEMDDITDKIAFLKKEQERQWE